MNTKPEKLPPLEDGLLTACRAIDNQIAREMQRNPIEQAQHGVQKWEPYAKRVEVVTGFLLDRIQDKIIDLDSLLVLAQAFTKSIALLTEDLGEKGLGKVRSAYVRESAKNIIRDATNAQQGAGDQNDLN